MPACGANSSAYLTSYDGAVLALIGMNIYANIDFIEVQCWQVDWDK